MSLLILSLVGLIGLEPGPTALADYVAQPDSAYKWEKRAAAQKNGVDILQLKMTSQVWHDVTWKHLIYVMKPKEITVPGHAILFITGGSWNDKLDEPVQEGDIGNIPSEGLAIAHQAGMPVIAITHVPFQPMFDGLVEDEIISLTFQKFLETKDPSWPLLFPMVKTAVRAMDTAQVALKQEFQLDIDGFTVTGASKRGWTTWLSAASGDPRVKGIMPIVIDTLNMNEQMKHQLDSYGEYSEQIKDYTEKGIQQKMDSDLGRMLNSMVDPYAYRRSLTLPKLIVNGTNDPYWTLDALNLYWDGLEGPKYIFYCPNGGHGLEPTGILRLLPTAVTFAKQSAGQLVLPKLDWSLDEQDSGLQLTLRSDIDPVQTRVWMASADTRDFRQSKWTQAPMNVKDDGFTYELPRPASGYAAAYAEGKYILDGKPAYFCTQLKIIGAKESADGK